MPNKTKEK